MSILVFICNHRLRYSPRIEPLKRFGGGGALHFSPHSAPLGAGGDGRRRRGRRRGGRFGRGGRCGGRQSCRGHGRAGRREGRERGEGRRREEGCGLLFVLLLQVKNGAFP